MVQSQSAPGFVMHGAREAFESGAGYLEEQIRALEEAVEKNPGLTFDLAKTILESTCKTVLKERGTNYDSRWDLPKLLKETLAQLQLVPEGVDDEQKISNSLRKTVGGLQTVIHGICELRNTHGFASHGKDASFQQLEAIQALLVARSADAIMSFLFRTHRNYATQTSPREIAYDDHPDFNDYVDGVHDIIKIFEAEFRPSEVLFQMEPETYRVYLADFQPEVENGSEADDEGSVEVAP